MYIPGGFILFAALLCYSAVLAMRKKWRKSLLTLLVAILVILLFIFVELQRVRVESQYHQKYGIPEEITKMKD